MLFLRFSFSCAKQQSFKKPVQLIKNLKRAIQFEIRAVLAKLNGQGLPEPMNCGLRSPHYVANLVERASDA